MNIKSVTYNGDYPIVTIAKRSGDVVIDTSNISLNGPGGNQGKLDRLTSKLQAFIDEVIPLSDFPADDPYVLSNPATDRIFWDGNGNIVFRNTLIEKIEFNGTKYFMRCRSLDHG